MASEFAISTFLQAELRRRGKVEIPAVEAAKWLDAAGLVADSPHRPGRPLRKLLREGKIIGARQEPNRYWFIERQSD